MLFFKKSPYRDHRSCNSIKYCNSTTIKSVVFIIMCCVSIYEAPLRCVSARWFWSVANFNWMKKYSSMQFFRFGWWANGNWQWSRSAGVPTFAELAIATLQLKPQPEIYRFDWIMAAWQLPLLLDFNRIHYYCLSLKTYSRSLVKR